MRNRERTSSLEQKQFVPTGTYRYVDVLVWMGSEDENASSIFPYHIIPEHARNPGFLVFALREPNEDARMLPVCEIVNTFGWRPVDMHGHMSHRHEYSF